MCWINSINNNSQTKRKTKPPRRKWNYNNKKSQIVLFGTSFFLYCITVWNRQLFAYLVKDPMNRTKGPNYVLKYKDAPIHLSSKQLNLTNQLILLHPGKSGGGSVFTRLRSYWHIDIDVCHPQPCRDKLSPSSNKIFFIPIRDPLERFLSAFEWRTLILCNPDGDSREVSSGAPKSSPTKDAYKYCKITDSDEANILYRKYRQNVSMLGEALCSDNQEIAQEAISDLDHIGHIRSGSLKDWLWGWKNLDKDQIIPMVLNKDYDFTAQIAS